MTQCLELTTDIRHSVDADGFAVVPGVVGLGRVGELISRLADAGHAMRNLLTIPAVREVALGDEIRSLVGSVLKNPRPVRSILFDKNPAANWKVTWHQDLSLAVSEKLDVPGFGPWSVKAGVPHVQSPAEILEGMLTVRLHLDDCDENNGPLRVIPGSHAHGILSADQIAQWRKDHAEQLCIVPAGGVVLMRPLLLHASSAAAVPSHRRVVHIEYAQSDLPSGLRWFEDA